MNYELFHGDCLEIMPKLSPGSVAMVFADLPYGDAKGSMTANEWDKRFCLNGLWKCVRHVRRAKGVTITTAKMMFAARLVASNTREFRHDIVYAKSRPTRHHHAKRMPLCGHEHVLVFASRQPTYNPQMLLREKPLVRGASTASTNYTSEPNRNSYRGRVYTHRHPTTVQAFHSEAKQLHPTQKPLALLEWLIATYTNPGDTVLDPVMGSGTTGHACANLGRGFIGVERDPVYFEAAKKRIEEAYALAAAKQAERITITQENRTAQ